MILSRLFGSAITTQLSMTHSFIRFIRCLSTCGILSASWLVAAEVPSQRLAVNLNREWAFTPGDVKGAEAPGFDDRSWSAVGLPHSFSLPYFAGTDFYTGYGWYRKTLSLPDAAQGKRLFLEFDGVFQVAEVFVNGKRVGEHQGGYTGFSFDITAAAMPGKNVVAVRVNNLWNARLAPRAGEHVFSGGIYRNVRLVATAPLHVAWYGTFVTTPQVSKESATVNVKTEIVNDSGAAKVATLRTTVLDAAGQPVSVMESRQAVPPGATFTFDQTSKPIGHPKLWHPDHPELYAVQTTVLDGLDAADELTSPLAFRWFKWTADQGFFLNGEHLYIYGANVHQDHAGWGDAVTDAGFERDVKMVKDAGFNFIRGSHYPHAPAFAAACDRLGVMLWSENAFWAIGGFRPDGYWNSGSYPPASEDQPGFEASVKQQLREMIRVHRNHPSIVAWSMGNETFFTDKSTIPRVKSFLAELVAATHLLDPTRPAAVGGSQRPLDENRIDKVGDLAGYNGDGALIAAFQNPGVPNIVSEYGSTTATRPGIYQPGWDQLASDQGKPVHPWRSGQVIWCMFDHGSLAGANLGRMGIVDYFRIPKRAWYWYRNEYRHIAPPEWPAAGTPAQLRLEADPMTLKVVDGTADTHLQVTVLDGAGKELSNSMPVTLELVSGPGEFPTGPSITFDPKSDIAILDGKAAIEFRSYHGGASVIRATSPGLPPAQITIVSMGEPRWTQGVTPTVKPRPYARFVKGQAASPVALTLGLATDRPTKASSSAVNFSSAHVNDGKAATVWQAARGDPAPWIRVDLENTYSINRVRLTFPDTGNYRYTIAVSSNGNDWTPVVGQAQNELTERVRTATGNFGSAIRFLRVSFVGWPQGQAAALAELEVGGGGDVKFNPGQLGGTIIGTPGSWQNNPVATKEAAMDGRPDTFFDAPDSGVAWVGLDFGRSARLARIRFRPRLELSDRMLGGQFQIANQADFSDATTVFTIATPPAQGHMTEQPIANAKPCRYVRYLAPKSSSGNVAEIEFYGQ
ncbi:MAG: glycoside hydrolase family 2 TIM barrel-domain containing protein [Verrucomicrobiota bacterium]